MRIGLFAVLITIGGAASAQGNLLRNGDFGTGNGWGWTTWRAAWGQQERWQFNDTSSGGFNLKLTALGGSFGVYQTVYVTPGKYYRIEARWKFSALSEPTWTEIELLQGGWDLQAADERPWDLPNKMYSYDNPENPPETFDWLHTAVLDGTPADINQYRGVRQATTSRMTIVLKAGGNPTMTSGQSVAAWFDDVSFYEVPEPSCLLILGAGLMAMAVRSRRPLPCSNEGWEGSPAQRAC